MSVQERLCLKKKAWENVEQFRNKKNSKISGEFLYLKVGLVIHKICLFNTAVLHNKTCTCRYINVYVYVHIPYTIKVSYISTLYFSVEGKKKGRHEV